MAYWIIVAMYVISLLIALISIVTQKEDTEVHKGSPSFLIFMGMLFAWLFYSAFHQDWNNLAILITIIWAARWLGGLLQMGKDRVVRKGKFFVSALVSLTQIILLLIYGMTY